MNILIYDLGNKEIVLQSEVLHEGIGDDFDIANSFTEAMELYKRNKYDVIIVDFTVDRGSEFLEEVMLINPQQATITLSYKHKYSVLKGCDYCVENYNRRRLIKPTSSAKLLSTLDTFFSPYAEQICQTGHQFDEELAKKQI